MKVLIQNYATPNSTEPLYINETINAIDGSESTLWAKSDVSAFDMFDIVHPDMFISHFGTLGNDSVKYLSSNKKISLILNVTGAQQEHIDMLNDMIPSKNINCPFIFTNNPTRLIHLISKKIKLVSIMSGADTFMGGQNIVSTDYDIDTGIITDYAIRDLKEIDSLTKGSDTYHVLTHDESLMSEPESKIDFAAPVMRMYSLYNKYKKMVVSHDDAYLSQSFFDSIMYGNETYYHSKQTSHHDKMDDVIKSFFPLSESLMWNGEEDRASQQSAKQHLLRKHTCLSRVQRLFYMLKCRDVENKIETLIQRNYNDHSSS